MHCSSCGQNLVESMKKENTWAYRAETLACHGCRAAHRAAKQLDDEARAGVRYRVSKIDARSNGAG